MLKKRPVIGGSGAVGYRPILDWPVERRHHPDEAAHHTRQLPILAAPTEDLVRIHVISARHDRHRNPGLVALRHDPALPRLTPATATTTNPPVAPGSWHGTVNGVSRQITIRTVSMKRREEHDLDPSESRRTKVLRNRSAPKRRPDLYQEAIPFSAPLPVS